MLLKCVVDCYNDDSEKWCHLLEVSDFKFGKGLAFEIAQ